MERAGESERDMEQVRARHKIESVNDNDSV